jgi:hypothetical protein
MLRDEIAKTLYRLHHETDEMWEGEKDYWYEDADAIMQLEVTTMCIDYDYGRYPYERKVTKTLAELEGSK